MPRPAFVITVDTEQDNAWSGSPEITVDNAAFLPRFQQLCERYGMRPTYLVTWEMANCDSFVEFARDVLARGQGEVGVHPHAWSTPPHFDLPGVEPSHLPYLVEYPIEVMREKLARLFECLESRFERPMLSHRAGRWALNEPYARLLVEVECKVDCSVTPHVSWRETLGAPGGSGGSDYRAFPERAYRMSPDDIGRAGDSPLLQVPMTIVRRQWPAALDRLRAALPRRSGARRALEGLFPAIEWLRPHPRWRRRMLRAFERALATGPGHLEMMVHSSELMPGGRRTVPDEASIERLYEDLERLLARAAETTDGQTLTELRQRIAATTD